MGGASQHDAMLCPVAPCFSRSRLDRTKKNDMEVVFTCNFIASRLVRSHVRCFVDFSLRLSLWPGHAKAMDE